MTTEKTNFLARLQQAIAVLSGATATESTTSPANTAVPLPDDPTGLKSRIRALELDIEERDARIRNMQQEFDQLRRQAEADRTNAGAAELEALARRLAPVLSQAPTMRAMHAEGKEVRAADLLKLFEKVERILQEAGLEPIGAVGERTRFDTRLHQRMSGGDVSDGNNVRVRFVGYRFKETILTKAMVGREE